MYNVVLIGCGHMGAVHLDDIYMMDEISVYGVVDTDIEKARVFAKKYHAKHYGTSYMRFMEDENVDIVICATYPDSHLEILKMCAKHKKHLLCEKPITANLKDAKEFVNIVKTSDIKVQVGFILRFNETYNKAAELIQEGALGFPLIIRMVQNHHVMNWNKYGALLKNTSPLVDCGVHYVDVCKWFTGEEVVSSSGIASKTDKEVPENSYNYGMLTLSMSGGSIAYYEAGWGNTIAANNTKEFIGPLGRIEIIERQLREKNQEEGDLIAYYKFPEKEYKTINVDCKRRPTGAQLSHLLKMIEENVPAIPSIDEVYENMRIVLEADEQLRANFINERRA